MERIFNAFVSNILNVKKLNIPQAITEIECLISNIVLPVPPLCSKQKNPFSITDANFVQSRKRTPQRMNLYAFIMWNPFL